MATSYTGFYVTALCSVLRRKSGAVPTLTCLSVCVWFQLPDGVELTLSELREMAGRQQQQIDDHQQQLVAKEQRLKYLKQQVRQTRLPMSGDVLLQLIGSKAGREPCGSKLKWTDFYSNI